MIRPLLVASLLLLAVVAATLEAQPDPYANKVAPASDEWKKVAKRMQLPPNVKVDLWAAEPLVANIVAFHFDEKGRCYVAETFRLHKGVTDNRSHMYWLNDDLACRTVADRVAMYKKHLKGKFPTYETDQDRVRLVEDTKGAGHADKSTIFADGFKNAADGIGSGVLARQGKVWYTCIPDLWFLQDTKGTGRADVKKSLQTGYGVHVAFLGHDMHGLRFGPDGRLYFSIGDRGLHVEHEGKTFAAPDTGSVLRCNPDGSELEIFATGLRNPQELAFDELGNLFTGDNNADGGDKARWVHLVDGGDSGWRIGYQYLNGPKLGVWNEEKLWHTRETNTASYLLPPLAHIGNGPSGLTYHPGTSLLPEKYNKHFFLCDFRGSGGGSGVHTFSLKPRGASFEVVGLDKLAWSVLATDCDFGPDGGFYISDWHEGWGTPNKGRIFKLGDPSKTKDPTVAEVKRLLADGMKGRSEEDLQKLLEHKDQRVRQEAQFELADRGWINAFQTMLDRGSKLAQLHAVWGIGQIARKKGERPSLLIKYAGREDADVASQAMKVLGESREKEALGYIESALKSKDRSPQVKMHAALAAGRIGEARSLPAVYTMLKANNDADPYLRHAGVMALAGIAKADDLRKAASDASPSVRLAALLAMRRHASADAALLLNDSDPKIVLEAARAIYDTPIPAALPKLAELARNPLKDVPNPTVLRILAANYRLGTAATAHTLVSIAGRSDVAMPMREQALKMLSAWEQPSGRDWVVGLWRPLTERPGVDVANALKPALANLMTGPDKIRTETAKLAAKHGMKEIGPALRELASNTKMPAGIRIDALHALETLKDAKLTEAAKAALADGDPRVRHQGRRLVLKSATKQEAVAVLTKVLDDGATVERQGAFALLAKVQSPEADAVLEKWFDKLLEKKASPDVQLDILLAAQERGNGALKAKIAAYEKTRDAKNPMDVYRESLVGGDADAGRRVFLDKAELSCVRCHKLNGVGGEVGPDLTGIGKKQKRDYLLESLVDPNRQIAKGYESIVLTLNSGLIKTGILKSEDAKEVRIMTGDGQLLSIPKVDIDERSRGPSAMPADLIQKMTRRELRDLVEFLSAGQ